MGSRKPSIEETSNANREVKISILVNAVYYFLESVFVVINEDHCRLVIIQNQKLIVDQCYDSLRGAKIAFYRMYKEKCCVKGLKTEWSISYSPDSRWLADKLKTAMPQPIYQSKLISSEISLTNAV